MWLELLKALFTAVLVAGAAAVAVWFVQRFAEDSRERYSVARDLLQRTADCASRLYSATQVFYRQGKYPAEFGEPDDAALDVAYREFGVTGEQLEWEIKSRYGHDSSAQETWHQVRDLFTVRYFDQKGLNTERLREINADGYEERKHSGLFVGDLEDMQLVLDKFRAAMANLSTELDKAEVRL